MGGAERHQGRSSPPTVRLVVLNYNGGSRVIDAVNSITRLEWPSDRLEIVVVDNASGDGSDMEVEQRFPIVRLIRSPLNLGFSANNLALVDRDDVDHIGLLNNDATVEPSWLSALVETLEGDPSLGAACPKILLAQVFTGVTLHSATFRPRRDPRRLGVRLSGLRVGGRDVWNSARFGAGFHGVEESGPQSEDRFRWTSARADLHVPVPNGEQPHSVLLRLAARTDTEVTLTAEDRSVKVTVGSSPSWIEAPLGGSLYDLVQNAGSVLTSDGFGADRGFLERDVGQYDEPDNVFAWCGAGVLMSRWYLDDIGYFDDRFFLYYEDTDMSWRGRARGWRYRYVPQAVQRHLHASTTIEGSDLFQYHVDRNRLLMLTKNAPRAMVADAVGRYVLTSAVVGANDLLRPIRTGQRPRGDRVARRVRVLGGFVRTLPGALRDRRRLRADQRVADDVLLAEADSR